MMGTNPAQVSVIQAVPKSVDLDCHVRVVEVEGVKVLEVRDYIPSLEEYGRGYWMPMNAESVFTLINALTEVARREGL